jgi:IS30 family transposase
MQTSYKRLSSAEREEISLGREQGESMTDIAKRLDRAVSTISRECARSPGKYRAYQAEQIASGNASSRKQGKTKIAKYPTLKQYVEAKLSDCWSPAQIAMRLEMEYPLDMTMRISPETLYQYVYVLPRGSLKQVLIKGLRQERKYRRKRKQIGTRIPETRGKIADMLSIEERPAEVIDRIVPGHWEGDLIIGKYKQSAIGTLVERTTRYTIIVPLQEKDAESVRKAFAKEIRTLPKELAKTLTYDQGKEMSGHKRFTLSTGMQVYFAHPASPWERGTNENTNGLIRQYFPKGTDFRTTSVRELKRVQRSLNGRPRKVLKFATPQEVFNQCVALDSRS